MPVTLPFLLLTVYSVYGQTPALQLSNGALPKPSIVWHQAPDATEKHYLQCSTQEKYAGSWFYLYMGGRQQPMAQKKALPTESGAAFEVHGVGPDEQFHCSYKIWEAGKAIHSPLSPPANLTEAHYLRPSIAASPSTEILVGQDWTLRCWAPFSGVSFVFYQAREFRYEVIPRGDSNVAEFSLNNVTEADEGRYTCYYHSVTEPVIWSNASNPVVLNVLGAAEVSAYQEVLVDSAGKYRVNCSMPSIAGGWFHLYDDGKLLAETRAWQNGTGASFGLTEEALNNIKGKLSCWFGENQLNNTIGRREDSLPLGHDFSAANYVRLGLGFAVLVAALAFVADAFWTERHQEK